MGQFELSRINFYQAFSLAKSHHCGHRCRRQSRHHIFDDVYLKAIYKVDLLIPLQAIEVKQ